MRPWSCADGATDEPIAGSFLESTRPLLVCGEDQVASDVCPWCPGHASFPLPQLVFLPTPFMDGNDIAVSRDGVRGLVPTEFPMNQLPVHSWRTLARCWCAARTKLPRMSVLGALVMLRFHYPSWYFYQHPIAFTQSPFAYMQPMTGEKFQIFVSIAMRWLVPWLLPVPSPLWGWLFARV